MRIDRPIGNESQLTGSFTGSFYGYFQGEHEGLSGSIQEIYNTINNVSESITQHFTDVSASISGTIDNLSGSFDQDRTRLSASFDSDRTTLSSSFDSTITRLSSSFDQDRTNLSSSFDRTIHDVSASISGTIDNLSSSFDRDRMLLSRSFAETIYDTSQSVDRTIRSLSQSFDSDRTMLSRSFDQTIGDLDQDLQSQINDTRETYTTTASFKDYQRFVDQTYYKSGSEATLDRLLVNHDATVDGDVWIQGNLRVEGSSSIVHTEEITVADKFVEIASGAVSAAEVDGAGFGIQGANVSMSYRYTLEGGYLEFNKPLVASSFTGSLQGDVTGDLLGNVSGNLEGTASNAVSSSYAVSASESTTASYAHTASYSHTSSYASEIWDDGTIALAIKRLENVARVKTENSDRGLSSATFYLHCGAHKDYQTCSVNASLVTLALPDRVIPGVEHYLLITNIGDQDCIVTGSIGVAVPPSVLSKYAWEYRYEYRYLEYTVPDVHITATQTIPSMTKTVFNGRIDGGDSHAVTKSRSITIDQLDIEAQATVPTPLTGSFVSGSGEGSGSGIYEDKFIVPQGQRLCLSYFTVDSGTVVITSAQRLRN